MCLVVKSGCKIEIAEKDITTYKLIYDGKDYWCGIFYSYPQFLYNEIQKAKHLSSCRRELGIIESGVDIEHLQIEKCGIINEGFHSHVNVNSYVLPIADKRAICIIPKGSEYCLGLYDDIVSNQIIVFKTREDYDRYITSEISSN